VLTAEVQTLISHSHVRLSTPGHSVCLHYFSLPLNMSLTNAAVTENILVPKPHLIRNCRQSKRGWHFRSWTYNLLMMNCDLFWLHTFTYCSVIDMSTSSNLHLRYSKWLHHCDEGSRTSRAYARTRRVSTERCFKNENLICPPSLLYNGYRGHFPQG
jgi:hypothetical protein